MHTVDNCCAGLLLKPDLSGFSNVVLIRVVQDMADMQAYSTSSGHHMVILKLTNRDRLGGTRNLPAGALVRSTPLIE